MESSKEHYRYIFSRNLKTLRLERGLNQSDAAVSVGIKQNSWSNYEKSRSYPDPDIIDRIVNFFKIDRGDLFKEAKEVELAPIESRDRHNSIFEFIELLEDTRQISLENSSILKSYVLKIFEEMTEKDNSLIKQNEKYEKLRDLIIKKFDIPL